MKVNIIFLLLSLGLASCTQENVKLANNLSNGELVLINRCRKLIEITETMIHKAGVLDRQEVRIENYPYLRINRFLSSFRQEVNDQNFSLWISYLKKLGLKGWNIELNNLPLEDRVKLDKLLAVFFPLISTIKSKLFQCSNLLSRFELSQYSERNKVIKTAIVPSAYNTWQQVLGLYPLTVIPFRLGIYRWHQETLSVFNRTLDSLPVKGHLIRYSPKDTDNKLNRKKVSEILQSSAENELHIPMPLERQKEQLFDAFSPRFEIDVASDNDKIGVPQWRNNNRLLVNIEKPTVYRHMSHTRLGNQTLLQLNYMIWFAARPKTWRLDLLGGKVDGIIWRVTLSPDGNPLIFDSIHTCGCYHFFFPTQYARVLKSGFLFDEPVFMPQNKINFNFDEKIVVRIGANNHQIKKIYSDTFRRVQKKYYQFKNADSLRSIVMPNGQNRNLYNQVGIIESSKRGERFLFWPMGVPNPGAMRQWGHHATAFVGRRHFDDTYLFEGGFEWIKSEK
ncbi:MAG: hypothetical protein KAH20_09125 [Methylococcales bacterium]|nr:hypothetical protein [Methylococcales bacterium]